MKQPAEMITGQDLLSTLQDLVRSRKICRMEIPDTEYGWFTVFLDLEGNRKQQCLVVDRVPGIEKALDRASKPVVAFEFLEKGGIPCRFRTEVTASDGHCIRVEAPEVIQRIQRRNFFRMKAPLGSEVILRENLHAEQRGTLRDYSLGGVAILLDPPPNKKVGDPMRDLLLRIPRGRDCLEIQVRLALVRRTSTDVSGRFLCALEFAEMEEPARELLWHHLLEEQRSSIRRFREL